MKDPKEKKQKKSRRTLKKVLLNLFAVLFAIVFTGNVIASENAGQINQVLGTKTSMTVSTAPAGTEETYTRYFESRFSSVAELKAAGEAKVREVEGEGIVLLKNENGILPLSRGSQVSLVGVTVMDPVYGGTGSGAVDADGAPNYYDVLTGAGYNVTDKALLDYYVDNELKRNTHEIGELRWKKVIKNCDDTIGQGEDAIFVVGRVGGEGDDVTAEKEDALDGDYLTLNEDELSILEGLKELKDDGDIRSITVIINSANPISTGFLYSDDYGVDAALWVGSVGQTGLYAVGDVLTGDVNPSGKLPFTWYASLDQCGAHATGSYPGTWREDHQIIDEEYKEGLFVGYRWTDRLKKQQPLFPFGHGLSYTTFKIGKVTADKKAMTADEQITFTVDVTNTGERAGAETVQLYISDLKASVERPVKELKGFSKVCLQPGETQAVSITIDKAALSFYDDQAGQWKAEPGDFKALIGNSSNNIVSSYSFTLK